MGPTFAWSVLSLVTTTTISIGADSAGVSVPFALAASRSAASSAEPFASAQSTDIGHAILDGFASTGAAIESSGLLTQLHAAAPYAIPLFCTIWALQSAHDIAHFVVARKYRLRMGPPLPLPSADMGLFGTHAPIRSLPPNRQAVADFALAGPLVGMSLSALSLFIGLGLTVAAPAAALDSFPRLSVDLLHSSMFLSSIVEAIFSLRDYTSDTAAAAFGSPLGSGASIVATPSMPSDTIPLHPLAIGGFMGMFTNSLAAIPLGKLDGGRATAACFGRGRAQLVSLLIVMILLGDATLNDGKPFLLTLWAVTALLPNLLQQGELPALEEATAPSSCRSQILFGLLIVATMCLAPVPLDLSSLTFGQKFALSGIDGVL